MGHNSKIAIAQFEYCAYSRCPCRVINEELYTKMRNLLQKILELLKPFLGIDLLNEFDKKTEKDFKYINRLLTNSDFLFAQFEILIEEHQEEIKRLPEYIEYDQAMLRDIEVSKHIGKVVGNRIMQSRLDTWTCIYQTLWQLLASLFNMGKFFDIILFNKLYCDLEVFFYNEYIPIVIIAPLHNFKSEIDTINLENGLTVRKITPNETQEFLKIAQYTGLIDIEIYSFKYVIEHKLQEKKLLAVQKIRIVTNHIR